jgi:hypothetical protein
MAVMELAPERSDDPDTEVEHVPALSVQLPTSVEPALKMTGPVGV